MIEYILDILKEFWITLTVMSPYLLFGFLVAGIMSVFISPKLVENHLGGRGIWSIVKASLFGVPIPLCSCGVIPVAVSLRKHGASRGASISFLLSTPQTGIDSIFVTYGLLGIVFAVFRPIIAFVTGVVGGLAVEAVDPTRYKSEENNKKEESECQDACCKKKHENKIVRLFKYGFLALPKDIGGAMLIGLAIAALIAAFVPKSFIVEGVETLGPFGTMLLMMVLGIPVYVCATASIPLAAVMIAKGLSPGAALVFLMTGPATNAAAFATIWKVMGGKTALVYIITVMGCALGSGLFLDALFPNLAVMIPHTHEMSPSVLGHLSAILLLALLLKGIYEKNIKKLPLIENET